MKNGTRHVADRTKIAPALQGVEWREMKRGIDWYDGSTLLVCVPVCHDAGNPESGWCYEMSVVDISCDQDGLDVYCHGDAWGWDLDDVDWFVVLSQ